MAKLYKIYDYKLHRIERLNNISVIANQNILAEDIQFQFDGSMRVKINNLSMPSSLQIVESDGVNTYLYDYDDGAAFTKAREFEITVISGYKYNIRLNNSITIDNLQIFYRRE